MLVAPIAGRVVVLLLYAGVSLCVRRPFATALDFRHATGPGYLLLLAAVAVLVLAILAPFPAMTAVELGSGYALGLAFVIVPQLIGIARRECIHQFEIWNLYPMRSILPRELLLCVVTFPAIAAAEEVVFRGILWIPELAIAAAQFLLYLTGSRTAAPNLAISCAFLATLHWRTGSLGLVIGAHAALQTLTGRLRSPGLFGGVYPLMEQARWKSLAPAWRDTVLEAVTGALLVALAS